MELAQILIEIFGPAAVTLILLLAAIQKMWPQLLLNQTQTREANAELIQALREVSGQSSEIAQQGVALFLQAHGELTSELGRISEEHRRFDEQMLRQHKEQMRALEGITEALRGVARQLNGR